MAEQTLTLAAALDAARDGVSVSRFDAISGLSGIGAYLLLRRGSHGRHRARAAAGGARRPVREPAADGTPRWFTPPELIPHEEEARCYPDGTSTAASRTASRDRSRCSRWRSRQGVEVDGLRDAIAAVAAWLAEHRADDAWGVNWPTMVGAADAQPAERRAARRGATAAPGVARALWLAGDGAGRRRSCGRSRSTRMERRLRPPAGGAPDRLADVLPRGRRAPADHLALRPRHRRWRSSPTPPPTSPTQLLDAYEPEPPARLRSLEPGGTRVDQPGLLDGAPGVALVLLAAATDVEPTWDRLFLLA